MELQRVEPSREAGERHGLARTDAPRQAGGNTGRHQRHGDEDYAELERLRVAHRAAASRHRVERHQAAEQSARDAHVPAEQHRKHERGRVDAEPGREPALDQEESGRERPGLAVEAALQILIGREDTEAAIDRDRRRADHDHRQRQAEIELHEAQPIGEPLSGRGQEGDRAGLGRHHRQRDHRPRHGAPGEQIVGEIALAATAPHAVCDEGGQHAAQHPPIDRAHRPRRDSQAQNRISSPSSKATSA